MAQSKIEQFQRELFGGMTLEQLFSSKEESGKLKGDITFLIVLGIYIAFVVLLFKKHKFKGAIALLMAPFILYLIYGFLALRVL